jgi:nucleoid DNA-binding protein
MTKAELIDRIARSRDLPPEITKKVIAKVLDVAFAELAGYFVRARVTRSSSPRFTFPKFGTFTKKLRSGRRGVNPRTLEPIEIEACETVDFKPSVELKRQLNEAPSVKPAKPKTARKKKAAARSSSKRKPASQPASQPARPASGKDADPAKQVGAAPLAKPELKARSAAGPGGRKLVTREEVELELPEAPLRRIKGRVKGKRGSSGSGLGGTGS